jgi:hypothetical protein
MSSDAVGSILRVRAKGLLSASSRNVRTDGAGDLDALRLVDGMVARDVERNEKVKMEIQRDVNEKTCVPVSKDSYTSNSLWKAT